MKDNQKSPPKIAEWLLKILCYRVEKYSLHDDLEEEYQTKLSDHGKTYSRIWYWGQALRAIPSVIFFSLYRSAVMGRNYATIALRNIRKHKLFSLINILGLAIGLSLCLFVIGLVLMVYSSDRFHENKNRIYRVISQTLDKDQVNERATAPLPLAGELSQMPEVETAVRLKKNFGGAAVYEDRAFIVQGLYADKDFFHVFSFELEAGNPKTALIEPYSIVLTKELSQKFFGNKNPIGEILIIKDVGDFTITGVTKDISKLHSHMKFECLASLSTLVSLENQKKIYASLDNWKNLNDNYVYLLLRENASSYKIENLLPEIVKKHYPDTEERYGYALQALTKISPGKNLSNFLSVPSIPAEMPFYLSAIAFIIMLIACFNYTNLSLAKGLSRAKEVGIRKTIGASRFKLFMQFIGESITYTLVAFVLAIFLLKLLIPYFFKHTPLYLEVESQSLNLVFVFFLFTVFTGIVAGIIPSIFISKFNPTEVLKDITRVKVFSKVTLHRTLVVIQFFISFVFIITTIVLNKQINFVRNIDPGFQAENILNVELQSVDYELFKQGISNHPGISRVSASAFIPCTGTAWLDRAKSSSAAEYFEIEFLSIDNNFIENLGLEMLAGQNFPATANQQTEKFVILNELAVERFGFSSPLEAIGQSVIFGEEKSLEVIGVIKNFLSRSTQSAASPLVLRVVPKYYEYANLKISTDDTESIILFLETKWKELEPYRPLRYRFFKDQLDDYYAEVV